MHQLGRTGIGRRLYGLWGCIGMAWVLSAPAQITSTVPHVIQISVDGLSAIYLKNWLAATPAAYPNFRRLIQEGASTLNARCDYDFSETMPNHASMLMGRPVSQPAGWPNTSHHGFVTNTWDLVQTYHNGGNTNVSYFFSVFDVIHDRGLSTAFFAGKAKLAICYVSYNETNGAPDLIGPDNGRNKVDHVQILDYWEDGYPCQALMNAVTNHLTTNAPNYLFLHLADLDYTGHIYGWGTAYWGSILADIDGCLGSLWAALARNPDLHGQTTIILTADHGGGTPLYTHVFPEYPLNYTIPFMIWGPGWPAETDLYTLLANRFDPGTNRLDFNAWRQPLRNGDAPNLALTLLGLPVVPGSSLRPAIGAKVTLAIRSSPSGLVVSWPSPAEGYVLESTESLSSPPSWQTVTSGIVDDGLVKTYILPAAPNSPMKYFQLKRELAR